MNIVLLLLLVLLGGCGTFGGGELMYGYARVSGDSMEPIIKDGDVVLVYPTPFETIEVGDVAVWYGIGGKMVAHRVIRRTDRWLWTRGDSEDERDSAKIGRGGYLGEVRR